MTSSLLTLHGTVGIRERIALPDGVVATVKIVDQAGEVLAATAVEATGVPVAWQVSIDPEMVADESRLQVWAALRTEVGLWGTLELQRVSEQIVLSRVDS